MRTVLVTGGAGYIGSHACKRLAAEGYEPVVYDNLSTGYRNLVRWGPLEVGDLRDPDRLDQVLAHYQPSAVLHFAGSAYVGESMQDPGKYYENNVGGSLELFKACIRTGVLDLVFSSTCATYGTPSVVPITEDAPQDPINPYGTSKLMVERMLRDLGSAHGLRSVSLRYFNAAGADPDGEAGEWHQPETHLLPLLLDVAAGIRDEAMVYGTDYPTRDGSCIRDYIHVQDLADAHVRAMRYLESGGVASAFNLGTGKGVTVLEAIRQVVSVTGQDVAWRPEPRREGDPPELVAAVDRARTELGWQPARSDLPSILQDAWHWHQHGRSAAELDRPCGPESITRVTHVPRVSERRGPSATVVIPTRNRVGMLSQTLKSVLDQEHVDLEVVVVDEGSSDDTPSFLERIGDDRVRVIRHDPAQGLAAARNAGIDAARTEWIGFVDDDDLWFPHKLRDQIAAAERIDAPWSYGGALLFTEGPTALDVVVPAHWRREHERLPWRNVVPGGGSNPIVRTSVLDEVGGFDGSISIVADWDMWIRLCQTGEPGLVASPVVAYRIHTSNMTSNAETMLAAVKVLEERHAHLRQGEPVDWDSFLPWLWDWTMRAGDRATARKLARLTFQTRRQGSVKRLLRSYVPVDRRPPVSEQGADPQGIYDLWQARTVVLWPDGAEAWLRDILAIGPSDLLDRTTRSTPVHPASRQKRVS